MYNFLCQYLRELKHLINVTLRFSLGSQAWREWWCFVCGAFVRSLIGPFRLFLLSCCLCASVLLFVVILAHALPALALPAIAATLTLGYASWLIPVYLLDVTMTALALYFSTFFVGEHQSVVVQSAVGIVNCITLPLVLLLQPVYYTGVKVADNVCSFFGGRHNTVVGYLAPEVFDANPTLLI